MKSPQFFKHYSLLKSLWVYLWSLNRKRQKYFIGSFICNILAIGTTILTPLIFRFITNFFSSSYFTTHPYWLIGLLSSYILFWTLNRLFIYLREILMFPVIEGAIRSLSLKLFDHIQRLPYDYHMKRKTGEITSIIEIAMSHFPPLVWSIVFSIGPLILEAISIFSVIAIVCGFEYSFILLVCFGLFFCVTRWGFLKALHPLRQANKSHIQSTSKIVDRLLNFSSIKYFNTYEFEAKAIDLFLKDREEKETKALIRLQLIHIYQTIILSLSFLILMILVGHNMISHQLSLGDFVMIHAYILHFTIPLEGFGQAFQLINQSIVNFERVLKILKITKNGKQGWIKLSKNKPLHIVFENVWFGYKKNYPILRGVSFEILPHQSVAIIGETGSGKSTIISLLARFFEPWSGRILINGHDLKEIDQEDLLNIMSIVPQEVTLFNDTIRHNILYSNVSAKEHTFRTALKIANLQKTIHSLPKGLNTVVGERGIQLSGGEKQRIGIARAFIRNPQLFIFDEATSSLDPKTEQSIMKNVQTISQNSTTLIITHRRSLVKFSDQLFTLKDGTLQKTLKRKNLNKESI